VSLWAPFNSGYGDSCHYTLFEMDLKNKCVEMTDFAVLPEYRKQGLSEYLLYLMEKIMKYTDLGCFTQFHGVYLTE